MIKFSKKITSAALLIITLAILTVFFTWAAPAFSAEVYATGTNNMSILQTKFSDSNATFNKCSININGKCYDIPKGAHNITVEDGKVVVDGKPYPFGDQKQITVNITVTGDVESIQGADTVTINGNVKTAQAMNGSITAQSIMGDATADNGTITVQAGDIKGSANAANGSISARSIGGAVSAPNGEVSQAFR